MTPLAPDLQQNIIVTLYLLFTHNYIAIAYFAGLLISIGLSLYRPSRTDDKIPYHHPASLQTAKTSGFGDFGSSAGAFLRNRMDFYLPGYFLWSEKGGEEEGLRC